MEGLSPSPRPRDVAHRCRLTGSAARMPGVGAEAAVCLAGVRLLAQTGSWVVSARVPVPPSPASALCSAPQGCCGDMPAMVADAQQNALRALRRAVRCAGRLAVLDGSAPRLLEAGSGEDAEDSVDAGALVSSRPVRRASRGAGALLLVSLTPSVVSVLKRRVL